MLDHTPSVFMKRSNRDKSLSGQTSERIYFKVELLHLKALNYFYFQSIGDEDLLLYEPSLKMCTALLKVTLTVINANYL